MTPERDPMGAAIADYFKYGKGGRLRVFSPDFDEDSIPLSTLFRTVAQMPSLERRALELSWGRVLDVGAGSGCHTLPLQERGLDVTAIDISPLSVETMSARGVKNSLLMDFWQMQGEFDTILMLMNGIGIAGRLERLPYLFKHISNLLSQNGILIFDSTDISYLYEDEEGVMEIPGDRYYGELQYQMQYKKIKGEAFDWLYVDYPMIEAYAAESGLCAQLIEQDTDGSYLATLCRRD